MHREWLRVIGGTLRISAVLLVFSFITQNLASLNELSVVQIPAGSLLLLLFLGLILSDIYRTFKWHFTRLRSKKSLSKFYLIIHFCLYALVFFIVLSIPMPTLISLDQSAALLPAAFDKITQETSDNITVIPSSSGLGYSNQTLQQTMSTDTNEPSMDNYSSGENDTAPALATGDSIPAYLSNFKTSQKIVNYEYVLRGKHSQIPYIVYGGMNDFLRSQPRYILYRVDQKQPTDIDFIKKDLDNEDQKPFIDPLIREIENITSNKDDQARIAISLVQNLEYDSVGLRTGNVKGKYPYEVLYTGCGVCSEKSELLAYMLRELGYEVVIFRFETEMHDAIGIKCPYEYSYENSGYCFVETTSPSIVTYSSGDYMVTGNLTTRLTSMPEKLKICNGSSFDSVSEEYNDAQTWSNIGTGKVLDEATYIKWKSLVNKYGIKTTRTD